MVFRDGWGVGGEGRWDPKYLLIGERDTFRGVQMVKLIVEARASV